MRYMLVRVDEGSVRLFRQNSRFFIETHCSIRAEIVMFVILRTLRAGEHFWQMLKHSDFRFSERWVLR